jgi:hypothetical protein
MARLKKPHRTLTIEEDNPIPGGVAKGLWKECPEIPLPRWGRALARNAPPKKYATSWYQRIVAASWLPDRW